MNESSPKVQKLNLSFDYKWIALALLVVIVAMLAVWKPWSAKTTERTVEVTGEATVSARPDEFIFYPTYEFTDADEAAALAKLTAKSAEVVAGIKKLGVADKGIKTNSDSWSYPGYDSIGSDPTYTLRLTVTVTSEELTQKVQDYLVTTTPTGSISPQANFSDKKRKELEDKARDEASKDARKKAEQSAKNLGFKLSAVKAVNDGSGFGIYPVTGYATDLKAESSRPTLPIQPGENDLTYTVTVTYYIK